MAFKRNKFGGRPQRSDGFRSGLEANIAKQLKQRGVTFEYEQTKLRYVQPAQNRTYLVDFELLDSGIYVEAKGLFTSDDRKKMLLIKEQYPDIDLRMVFSSAGAKIYKGSKTTHAMWCEKHGIPWAHRLIPESWFKKGK